MDYLKYFPRPIKGIKNILTNLNSDLSLDIGSPIFYRFLMEQFDSLGKTGVLSSAKFLTTKSGNDYIVRKNMVDEKIIDCVLILPEKLFNKSKTSYSLLIIDENRGDDCHRKNEILIIDARCFVDTALGVVKQPNFNCFNEIPKLYNAWYDQSKYYEDVSPFWGSIRIEDIKDSNYTIIPSNYFKTGEFNQYNGLWFEDRRRHFLYFGYEWNDYADCTCHKCSYRFHIEGCDSGFRYLDLKSEFSGVLCSACIGAVVNNGIYDFECEACHKTLRGVFDDFKSCLSIKISKLKRIRMCQECQNGFFGVFNSSNRALMMVLEEIINYKDTIQKTGSHFEPHIVDYTYNENSDSILVRKLTNKNYRKYKKQINPYGYEIARNKYHIDHIIPIAVCRHYNIPSAFQAMPENLQVIPSSINSAKSCYFDPRKMFNMPDEILEVLSEAFISHPGLSHINYSDDSGGTIRSVEWTDEGIISTY